jgi:hypothetical protein
LLFATIVLVLSSYEVRKHRPSIGDRMNWLLASLLLSVCSGFVSLRLGEIRQPVALPASFLDDTFKTEPKTDRDAVVLQIIERARSLGPVGLDCSEEEQASLVEEAKEIAALSDDQPARSQLTGLHNLVYSASPGGSSGKVGPFVGKVTQEFVDDKTFYNAVEFGPLKISLRAEREVKSDTAIKVTFRETTVTLFGNKVTSKIMENSGGVWKYLFSGVVTSEDGRRKLVRLMETPSLFVLEQYL